MASSWITGAGFLFSIYPTLSELVFQALKTQTRTLFIRMTNMLSDFCYALFHLTDSDSESEGMDVGSSRTPILVISGDPGLGKTTCVYTMSSMQDFKVIISPSPSIVSEIWII